MHLSCGVAFLNPETIGTIMLLRAVGLARENSQQECGSPTPSDNNNCRLLDTILRALAYELGIAL